MPNIELFGYPWPFNTEIKEKIRNALKGVVSDKEVVFSEHQVEVTDLEGKYAPFIRLTTTPIPELNEVVNALLKVLPDVDIEVMLLQRFYPRKK